MFLALHVPVRGVQKELSHEVKLFSVPKKLPGVKLFFSIYLPFFVHEKADMYPVFSSYTFAHLRAVLGQNSLQLLPHFAELRPTFPRFVEDQGEGIC